MVYWSIEREEVSVFGSCLSMVCIADALALAMVNSSFRMDDVQSSWRQRWKQKTFELRLALWEEFSCTLA